MTCTTGIIGTGGITGMGILDKHITGGGGDTIAGGDHRLLHLPLHGQSGPLPPRPPAQRCDRHILVAAGAISS
ncbi:UNVERIFIED_CONTAM: hypothetical protein BEN50_25850 [Euhalothece sp. KZN 001]